MPSLINCDQQECLHNIDERCGANVIRVRAEGKGKNATFCDTATENADGYQNTDNRHSPDDTNGYQNNTFCDTATDNPGAYTNTASEHMKDGFTRPSSDGLRFEIGESLEPGTVGPRVSCTVSNCSHNNSYICKYNGRLDIKETKSRFSPLCSNFTESL